MGSHGLRHLGALQDLTDLHLIVMHFDRVKRRDLEWMLPSSSVSAAHGQPKSAMPWPELKKVTLVVIRSIYHDCHLDAKRWILEMLPNVAFDIHLDRGAHI
ncbi:hypothetical protein BGZ68_001169 [Mortierella alpina]|nr:hypothetical protein BGZ68_001169 [Mortierella alpina]